MISLAVSGSLLPLALLCPFPRLSAREFGTDVDLAHTIQYNTICDLCIPTYPRLFHRYTRIIQVNQDEPLILKELFSRASRFEQID